MITELDEYQRLAGRTAQKLEPGMRLVHGALGMTGEQGEFLSLALSMRPDLKESADRLYEQASKVAELVKKTVFYQAGDKHREQLVKEAGDWLWYFADLLTGLQVSMSEVATKNVEKLKARFPEGFTSERANNHDGQ